MKILVFVMALHIKGELTPRRVFQLVQDPESAALMLYNQQKTAPLTASVTGELYQVDLLDRVISKQLIPVIRFETIGG